MRRYAIVLGMAAALAAATAAPAAAHTITPGSYDWGQVDPKTAYTQPLAEFDLKAETTTLSGLPTVISGASAEFNVLVGFCDGSLSAGQSCTFRVRVNPNPSSAGAKSAVVGIPGGPTATVKATFPGGSSKGKAKKKGCKKKGKKGAAAAKKKGCKKKGKK